MPTAPLTRKPNLPREASLTLMPTVIPLFSRFVDAVAAMGRSGGFGGGAMNLQSVWAGFALLGVALWQFLTDGISVTAILFGGAALAVLVLGTLGKDVEAEKISGTVDFLTDPAEAIVDAATDRLGDWLKGDGEPEQRFDPDAAIARYLENRPEGQPTVVAPPRELPGFGRKGSPSA